MVALIERWLPQNSHFTVRETYTRHSSLIEWSTTPLWKMSRHESANAQNAFGACARTAELSGRGVPSRAQRSISACIRSSIVSSGT